ncbi:MAG: DUF2730 family protein [Pseudomonadota bacterium]
MTFDFDPTVTISAALSVIAMFVAWFRTRRADLENRLKQGSDQMDDMDRRLVAAEQKIAALPETGELHRLELHLTEISGDMKAMAASMRGQSDMIRTMKDVLSRHEQHLMEEGRK